MSPSVRLVLQYSTNQHLTLLYSYLKCLFSSLSYFKYFSVLERIFMRLSLLEVMPLSFCRDLASKH